MLQLQAENSIDVQAEKEKEKESTELKMKYVKIVRLILYHVNCYVTFHDALRNVQYLAMYINIQYSNYGDGRATDVCDITL